MISQKRLNISLCHFCERLCAQSVCKTCLDHFPKIANCCYTCIRPLPENGYCIHCLKKPKSYQYLIAATLYHSEVDILIKKMKFNDALYLLAPLGQLLLQQIQHFYGQSTMPKAIIPMPLHPKRIQQRGYNQALELSKALQKPLNLPILKKACQRVKNTQSQTLLSPKERAKNIKNAFTAYPIPFSHIAIVDDIVTTGLSAEALSQSLKKANPSLRIDLWSLAKTPEGMAH